YANAGWTSNEPPLLLVVSVVPGRAARERVRASPSCTRVAIKRSKVFYLLSELRAARNVPGVPPVAPVRLIGYPLAMAFRPQDLHDFDIAREIRIETHTPEHSTRSTIIWVVVDNGQIFVRSVRGERGVWYKEALATPAVTIDDRGRRLEATAVPVHDADSIRRVSEALQRKYARDEGLAEMLEASSLDATFRLEPRTADEV